MKSSTDRHILELVPVAFGAAIPRCSCGWQGTVADDKMCDRDYVSASEQFLRHQSEAATHGRPDRGFVRIDNQRKLKSGEKLRSCLEAMQDYRERYLAELRRERGLDDNGRSGQTGS